MAPNWPSSLRSKITTDITLVLGVNRMIEADSSRMTPMKMKHQAAMMPLRASGAVIVAQHAQPARAQDAAGVLQLGGDRRGRWRRTARSRPASPW